MANICDVMNSMMLTAYGDITFPGRYWSLFPFIYVTLTDSNMPTACTAIIFLCKHFSFDLLNNTVFRNSWPVWHCRIFKNYLAQTDGFKKKKNNNNKIIIIIIIIIIKNKKKTTCNMNCVFSVQLLPETLLLPVQGVVQWGLMGRHDITNRRFCNSANPPKKQGIT